MPQAFYATALGGRSLATAALDTVHALRDRLLAHADFG